MIDLHTHSTCSDGMDTPFVVVKKALASGITMLGVTDHDTTSGWNEARSAIAPQIQLVLGAEISCLTDDGISVHMLGLLFDGENAEMQSMLADSRDSRIPRMRKMVALLQEAGFDITMEDVLAASPDQATLGRPHLADALVAKRIVKDRTEAFAELLHNDSKFYVAHLSPTPVEAITTIRAAGGVSVIAHPFASRRGQTLQSESFQDLVDAGLNGIEVHHRDQSPEEQRILSHIATELDLAITGSSDYHGAGKVNQLGENTTDPHEFEKLESQANARRVISI
jgi:predicted metal-dependent phosphoesterase TrpH